jgi:hypothetical protein
VIKDQHMIMDHHAVTARPPPAHPRAAGPGGTGFTASAGHDGGSPAVGYDDDG